MRGTCEGVQTVPLSLSQLFVRTWSLCLQVEEPGAGAEDAVDCRQWTQHHLVAADIRVAPAMALTPPQGDVDADGMDVNVRGPGQRWGSRRQGCPFPVLLVKSCIWVCVLGRVGCV